MPPPVNNGFESIREHTIPQNLVFLYVPINRCIWTTAKHLFFYIIYHRNVCTRRAIILGRPSRPRLLIIRAATLFESRASISGEGVRMFLGRRNVSTYSVLQTESIDFYHHFLKRVFMRLPQEKTAV